MASIYLFNSAYAIGSVPSLSGHAIAYRRRSLPRVRRHRAGKAQRSSERVLPWQVTMDQLLCASLPYTHYLYEVGMLKVVYDIPAYTAKIHPTRGKHIRFPARDVFILTPQILRHTCNISPKYFTKHILEHKARGDPSGVYLS